MGEAARLLQVVGWRALVVGGCCHHAVCGLQVDWIGGHRLGRLSLRWWIFFWRRAGWQGSLCLPLL